MSKLYLYIFAVALLAAPMGAHAAIIQITGFGAADGYYEVSTVTGLINEFDRANSQLFQPWYGAGEEPLATAFAEALGGALGFMNNPTGDRGTAFGPMFANFISATGASFMGSWCSAAMECVSDRFDSGVSYTFAVASRVPEPGTLALMGLGLFGVALARRRRETA